MIDFFDALEENKDLPDDGINVLDLARIELLKQGMPDPVDATAVLKRKVEDAAEELKLLEQMNRIGEIVPKVQEQLVKTLDKERMVMINQFLALVG